MGYRGSIWIVSSKRIPIIKQILQIEVQYYEKCSSSNTIIFPSFYPINSLVGCLDFVQCLDDKIYKFSSTSNVIKSKSLFRFIFLCRSPRSLLNSVYMKQNSRICILKKEI